MKRTVNFSSTFFLAIVVPVQWVAAHRSDGRYSRSSCQTSYIDTFKTVNITPALPKVNGRFSGGGRRIPADGETCL